MIGRLPVTRASRKPTVAILGAGAGGICMGIRCQQAGYDYTIFEKSDGVGGTWRDNGYPGAACDVPSHIEKIGNQMREGLTRIAAQYEIPLTVSGFAPLTSVSFDHPQNAALLTLFTAKMLERGFLAGGGFYPTLAHTMEHVAEYLAAAQNVLEELGEAIRKNNIAERLSTPVKHAGFARLN